MLKKCEECQQEFEPEAKPVSGVKFCNECQKVKLGLQKTKKKKKTNETLPRSDSPYVAWKNSLSCSKCQKTKQKLTDWINLLKTLTNQPG